MREKVVVIKGGLVLEKGGLVLEGGGLELEEGGLELGGRGLELELRGSALAELDFEKGLEGGLLELEGRGPVPEEGELVLGDRGMMLEEEELVGGVTFFLGELEVELFVEVKLWSANKKESCKISPFLTSFFLLPVGDVLSLLISSEKSRFRSLQFLFVVGAELFETTLDLGKSISFSEYDWIWDCCIFSLIICSV
jgi:hypothetical protein